jgi:hypothetical protein
MSPMVWGLVLAALVIGAAVGYGLSNASDDGDDAVPVPSTSTTVAETSMTTPTTVFPDVAADDGETVVATGSVQVSGTLDDSAREQIAFYLASHESTVDEIGPDDGAFVDPAGGRWAEVRGDSSCTFEVIDANGRTTASGTGALIVIPAGQRALRTEPRCAWLHLAR